MRANQLDTKPDFARFAKTSVRHVENLIYAGVIPVVRFGRLVRIDREQALEALLKAQNSKMLTPQ